MSAPGNMTRELDAHIVSLLSKLKEMNQYQQQHQHQQHQQDPDSRHGHDQQRLPPMSVEAWSLEFWRAVAVECFATFLFAFIVAGAAIASAVSGSGLNVLATAIASGFAIAAVQLIFGPVSGGHVNPAVTVSFALSRKVSAFRAIAYGLAQCGGGVAGAAMLYGVANAPQNLISTPGRLSEQAPLKLLVELALSTFVILAHYCAESPKSLSSAVSAKPACVLAAAYTACTLVSAPFLNPARALGIAFVTYRWDNHWVQWMGPIAGSMIAALVNEYVLSNNRRPRDHHHHHHGHSHGHSHHRNGVAPDYDDGDNSSLRSDDETYDDLENKRHKFPGGYATYRPVAGGAAASIYGPAPTALERVESIYGGTKSLYCKSPPLTRANLNRSQSVYAKRDGLIVPKPGALQPAQSLYPIRLNSHEPSTTANATATLGRQLSQQHQHQQQMQGSIQSTPPPPGPPAAVLAPVPLVQNHNSTNQNMQNQLQQCTQNIYGIRGITTSIGQRDNIYGHLAGANNANHSHNHNNNGNNRDTSIYGRAPAPPPTTHCVVAPTPISQHHQPQQVHQHQQSPQQLPTRDNGPSHSPHQGSQDGGSSSTGGSMRRGPTSDLQQQQQQHRSEQNSIQLRPESNYGHTQRRAGDDSAYNSYQSSSRGGSGNGNATYGKITGPPPPPHGINYQQQQQQQQQQSRPPNGLTVQQQHQANYNHARHSPNLPPPQY